MWHYCLLRVFICQTLIFAYRLEKLIVAKFKTVLQKLLYHLIENISFSFVFMFPKFYFYLKNMDQK